MKVEVFEIYSDGVEAKVGSLSIDPTGKLSMSPNISGKKLIAKKFKWLSPENSIKCSDSYILYSS
jgi:hypothetical protein